MVIPTTQQFFDAAVWTYRHDSLPPLPYLEDADGQPLMRLEAGDGFFAAALVTPAGDVIIAFEGTDLGGIVREEDREFVIAQLRADALIYFGETPPAFIDAYTFTDTVIRAAAAQGISRDHIFVTGHSLGGGEAEYVSAHFGLGGETFGAPGVSVRSVPQVKSTLTAYVEFGDPVGNYSAHPNVEGNFLYSDDIVRVGHPKYLGSLLSVVQLEIAGRFFGPGTTREQNATGLLLLAAAAAEHHVVGAYSRDLFGVPVPGPDDLNFTTAELIAAARLALNGHIELLSGRPDSIESREASTEDDHDTVEGGDGSDTLRGRGGDDVLYGNGGDDILDGELGDDLLEGNAGRDRLGGGVGSDTLSGGAGGDWLFGGAGKDWLRGDDGTDDLSGEEDDDLLDGGGGNDRLFGGIGDDGLHGGDGNDVLEGQAGDDRLGGGAGNDALMGGDGEDRLFGGDGADTLRGENGNDELSGEQGNDILEGGEGNDKLFGGIGDDHLDGGDGDDLLEGQAGIDRLEGGGGDDVLRGDDGVDTFVFRPGFGRDQIEDFRSDDVIEFRGQTIGDFDSLIRSTTQMGANLAIDSGSGTLIVLGVQKASLAPDDFRFL